MPNLGPTEILIVLIVLALIVGFVALLAWIVVKIARR